MRLARPAPCAAEETGELKVQLAAQEWRPAAPSSRLGPPHRDSRARAGLGTSDAHAVRQHGRA